MTGIGVGALVAVAVWLALLTLGLILCIRELTLLRIRVDRGPEFSVDDDGLSIGEAVPPDVLEVIPQHTRHPFILLLSATCGPCRELAESLGATDIGNDVIVLVPGREELAEGMVSMLPEELEIVRDPKAVELARSLRVQSTPFLFAIADGVVESKKYVRSVDDFLQFVDQMRNDRRAKVLTN